MINANVSGRLGRDAELKEGKSGRPFLKFTIASDAYRDGAKATDWVSVAVFGKRAEYLAAPLTKGTIVSVAGQLSAKVYNDKIDLSIVASDVAILGGGAKKDYARPTDDDSKDYARPTNDDSFDPDNF